MLWLQDGTLNDAELNEFQVECFSAPLQPEELAGVKKVVSQKMPQVRDLPRSVSTLMWPFNGADLEARPVLERAAAPGILPFFMYSCLTSRGVPCIPHALVPQPPAG